MSTNTVTTIAARYADARAAIASAESAYLAACGAWADAVDNGEASIAALTRAAGISAADGKAVTWVGRAVRQTIGETLPYRGVVALEADIRAILKSGKGGADTLADVLEDAASLADAAEAIEKRARSARKASTRKRQDTGEKADDTGETPDAPDAPATPPARDAARLMADAVALVEQAMGRVEAGDDLPRESVAAMVAAVQRLNTARAKATPVAS